ncbi:hypothetical protein ARMSODRAFT_1013525 [Armillaria solidipes]|uniref:Zn(2)-C6 fungal-type domain-containing protein n=1 Tax=Armillaria solidipes TaxID=1076256 RepID=A0A2H3CH91_9AGAR|nr:hypothetical protein ARMSODRAFT_1013525 [Armillaria solidipes]
MAPSNPPAIMAIGPAEFRVCITPGPRLAQYHITALEAYSEGLVEAHKSRRGDEIKQLHMQLMAILADVGVVTNWDCIVGAEMLPQRALLPPPPAPESDGLQKILHILHSSGFEPPEEISERNEWCTKIVEIAWKLSHEELRLLKKRCPSAVWAVLVFTLIRPTPARMLVGGHVCKVKIEDWDLFPVTMEPTCLNCVKKGHPCTYQNSKISKCRECALFGIGCPKDQTAGKRKLVEQEDERSQKRARYDTKAEEEIAELKAQIVQLQEQVAGITEVLNHRAVMHREVKGTLWEIFDALVDVIKKHRPR